MDRADTKRGAAREASVEQVQLSETAAFPSPRVPILLYRAAFAVSDHEALAARIERTFHRNGWTNGWRDTVYDFHHYHSVAHEVLGCYRGHATLQLGGADGPTLALDPGDVLLLPAGTAHKKLVGSDDFCVVGCYAEGRDYDMLRGAPGERPEADERIRRLQPPSLDPVYGADGPLSRLCAAQARN